MADAKAQRTSTSSVCTLDERSRKLADQNTGKVTELPALHPTWCHDVGFLEYTTGSHGNKEMLDIMGKDLEWLLQASHGDFWNQVIFDHSLQRFLDTYLQLAPRRMTEASSEIEKVLHRRVYMTFLRMSTHKETPTDQISRKAFGEIIYDNFLFDIPKIFDLCCLYGNSNKPLLSKMVANVFNCQPKYFEDLKTSIAGITKVLARTADEVRSIRHSESSSLTAKIEDIIYFLCDFGVTMRSFLEVYPQAAIFYWESGIPVNFLSFYDEVIPTVQYLWKSTCPRSSDVKVEMREAKQSWIDLLHLIVTESLVSSKRLPNTEDVVSFLTTMLSHSNFLRQFQRQYNMADLVAMVTEAQNLDEANKEYLKEVTKTSLDQLSKTRDSKDERRGECHSEVAQLSSVDPQILAVKEVLPHLHDDLIATCLKEYGSPSDVITAVLEGRVSQSSTSTPASSHTVKTTATPVEMDRVVAVEMPFLDSRENIFDNDEFDLFRRRDVDTSRIHKGKKSLSTAILNEKFPDVKTRIIENYEVEVDEYDDEYDDTYDSVAINVSETAKGDYLHKFEESNDEEEDGVEEQESTIPQPNTKSQEQRNGDHRRGRGRGRGGPVSQDELKQRNWKEKHKSFTSNHNRKSQARKKQQRGMF